ncbi:MAG: sulfatase-like hydrolase/transferase [Planctomycetaceae bacterium]|jgi:arylsulfatase A-like enzyme|nr:sulfatase-like hydrolase/transferase [Planctomycetaceae bacterium]
MNIFCLSIDGFHSGMIGAYGNSWIQTPSLDRLASQSVLFDRCYVETLDLSLLFDSLWRFRQQKERTVLLTDDNDIFFHAKANNFDKRYRLKPFESQEPVSSLEETQFFTAFAAALDLFREQKHSSKPCFLWTHLQGFRGRWDFPISYRESHRGDEDPVPYSGVEIPYFKPPYGKLAPKQPNRNVTTIDPDKIQSVMEGYSGGVAVLDHALAGLLDSLENGELGDETLFLLFSTRGFSLGEHGRIGADNYLYSENVQIPLCVRFPDGFGASVRIPALFGLSDLASFLNNVNNVNNVNNISDNKSPFFDLVQEKTEIIHERLRLTGRKDSVLVTPDWFFRKVPEGYMSDGYIELYVKPDDRWETNNVADRCPEIVEELTLYFEK